jgi:L-rhamnose mutarotase
MNPFYGPTNLTPEQKAQLKPQRHTLAVELKPEKEGYYRELHASVWPSILERLAASHIHNYSISIAPLGGRRYLIAYFEYWGDNFEADSAAIAADPETCRWWLETDPCQTPLEGREPGKHWLQLEEVFYFDALRL